MLTVPPAFAEATAGREGDTGRAWIGRLPELAAEFLERWSCTVSGPPAHGSVGLVLPVARADGSDAVLKLSFPLDANAAEPVVLAAWNGDGAARLLDRDDDRCAMLLERLDPLGDKVPDPFTAVGRLVRRLAVPAPPGLPSLADRALRWVAEMPAHAARLGNPVESALWSRDLREPALVTALVDAIAADLA